MTAPNRNTLWARAMIDELVAAGVDAVVNHDAAGDETIDALLARPFRAESQ